MVDTSKFNDLGFLLKPENVAWYEDGKVRILDRRIYPVRTEFVVCERHEDVAQADRKSTRLNSSHPTTSRMPSSA